MDEIDRVNAAPARTTSAESLRNSPEMQAFREQVAADMIAADTASKALAIFDRILDVVLKVGL
ncbi:MAG: hypothetical protein ACKV2Q_36625 [Planctomycetaceae bacterium]